MINKIKYIIIFFLIGGCSSIEFTYKNDLINSPLDNNIQILIKGDDKSIISREVKSSFNEKEGADFVLEITSKKTQKNQTINTDGTASKILITHSLKYYLKILRMSVIFWKKIFHLHLPLIPNQQGIILVLMFRPKNC